MIRALARSVRDRLLGGPSPRNSRSIPRVMDAPNLSPVEHPSWERVAPWVVREMTTPFEVPDPTEMKCAECGRNYEALGQHWSMSAECRHPPLTQKQRELVTGLMLSDGNLYRGGKNPYLRVGMTSPKYLEYLDREFGPLATGVRLKQTKTESARQNRDSGFQPDALAENRQDVYSLRTRSLPDLHDFDWYGSGEKVFPSDIDLTPTVLKHWYCGDGCYNNHGTNDRITIAMNNEVEHTDKVDALFERADLPTPSNYHVHEHEDGHVDCTAQFSVDASHELFEFMQPAPPGFRYKFPDEYC